MRFSVIVPIYNVEKYLPQCIESILSQDFVDYELILVCDGPTDNSYSICEQYSKNDSRIRIIKKENGGPVSARKAGAMIANGEYVIILDGDDFIEPGYFTYLDKIISKYNSDIISFGHIRYKDGEKQIVENSLPVGEYKDSSYQKIVSGYIYSDTNDDYVPSLCWALWSKCFRRQLYVISQTSIDDDIFIAEDVICNSICLHSAKSLYASDRVFYNYRMNEDSITNKYNPTYFRKLDNTIEFFLNIDYIKKEAIDYYAYNSLLLLLCRAAVYSSNYSVFNKIVKESLDCKVLWKYAKKFKYPQCGFKERMKKFCIEHELFIVIYVYFKYLVK